MLALLDTYRGWDWVVVHIAGTHGAHQTDRDIPVTCIVRVSYDSDGYNLLVDPGLLSEGYRCVKSATDGLSPILSDAINDPIVDIAIISGRISVKHHQKGVQENFPIEIDSHAKFGVGASRCDAFYFVAGIVGCRIMRGVKVGIPVNVRAASIVVGEQVGWTAGLCGLGVVNRPGHIQYR